MKRRRDTPYVARHPGEDVAEQLAARETFRARVDLLLVELTVAARNLGSSDPAAHARRALELLVEHAARP